MRHYSRTEPTMTLLRPPHDVVREHAVIWAEVPTEVPSVEIWAVDSADRGLRGRTTAHDREALACYEEIGCVHTAAFHLRQVFGKLHIRSRVELARQAVEREHAQHYA
ncbi:MAG: hypothetical protein JWN95_2871 [Frankiales bacterium]|nr:hypothetical protein [Frankiales bacterium]